MNKNDFQLDTDYNSKIEKAQISKNDKILKYNKKRWSSLVEENAIFTRPKFDLDKNSAKKYLDPEGKLGNVVDKNVLCLAGGGGQQSAAFGVLGADVTVFDLSEEQLKRDIKTSKYYGYQVRVIQGDMRDLSYLDDNSFDIVWHPYSLNFVPDARVVFEEVAKVIKSRGIYYLMCANPFVWGMTENDWDGEGYSLKYPYKDGLIFKYKDQEWVFRDNPPETEVKKPREYRQTLSRLINGLIEQEFIIFGVKEVMSETAEDDGDPPGSWGHFTTVAPPWIKIWSSYRPELRFYE